MKKTVEDATQSTIRNLEEKTGKSLVEWIKVVRAAGALKHGEVVALLKSKHGITHGYANLVALKSKEAASGGPASGEDLVAAQYAGSKAGLRPSYESLLAEIQKFGADVEVSPKKAYVSLRRSKQFALIQPSTADRLDVGICLKGTPPGKRLEASGSFNAMCTHRVRVAAKAEIDRELLGWLRKAYDAS